MKANAISPAVVDWSLVTISIDLPDETATSAGVQCGYVIRRDDDHSHDTAISQTAVMIT